ncbi:MAG: folate family ECF transporter S component [Clostridia bacterium]|nr:folate family ECF transporter S component [Clostridia bacterium]
MNPGRLKEDFIGSARMLRQPRCLALSGLMLALQVILGMSTIQIDSSIQITFDYLPLYVTAYLCGPVPAMLTGGLSDLIAFLIRPTGAFNPGFTLSAALSGLIYSLFVYRKDFDRPWMLMLSVALARLTVAAVCNVCLNSAWLILMYGQGALAWIPGRLLKNLIEYPISILLIHSLHRLIARIQKNTL